MNNKKDKATNQDMYLKKNYLRRVRQQLSPSNHPNAETLMSYADHMEASQKALDEYINNVHLKAYGTIIKALGKRYKLNEMATFDMLQHISNFSDQYANILNKMLEGEPIHLAKLSKPKKSSKDKPVKATDSDSDDYSDNEDDSDSDD